MCFGSSIVLSSGVFPCQRTIYFSVGRDPLCYTMRSTVYSRLFVARRMEVICLLDEDVGTFDVELACDHVCMWGGYNERVNAGLSEGWVSWSMDTILDFLFLGMVTVCNLTLPPRRCPTMLFSNLS